MSAKSLDQQGRWRSKTVAFRVSPEEDALIEKKVALSGLTKQEYITRRLQEEEIVVVGNPRVYKALKNQMAEILSELKRLEAGRAVNEDLMSLIRVVAATMDGMKEDGYGTAGKRDA